ncbi:MULTISPECIES: hypothetical protein [unclassified Yoonia]|uniref:hypothetical protein n=1 Tax=unclassified Yoonia TaxID=2629118 RepID=UPI002AFF76F4|nr:MULTISPECIES: hypothetical protein [unclassified Yoonia]
MSELAQAVHDIACAYGSLDAALSMTPRQLIAAQLCNVRRRSNDLSDMLSIQRTAAHGSADDMKKTMKELSRG